MHEQRRTALQEENVLYLSPVLAFAATIGILLALMRPGVVHLAMDLPNERSLHRKPVPRVGGVALIGGVLVGWVPLRQEWLLPLVLIAGGLAAVSFVDDLRGLPVGARLVAHLVAGGALVFAGSVAPPGALQTIAVVAGTVWLINLYNFMDGSDGLAGGMAVFGFGGYALAAYLMGDAGMAAAALTVSLAALAFLLFNFNPARVFMGDAGSTALGFLAAALGLIGLQRDLWPPWFPLLVFSPFLLDASVTLAKRLLAGQRVWQAHREHYYQRLIRAGWSHRRLALAEYGLMIAAAGSAVWGITQPLPVQLGMLAGWLVTYAWLANRIDRLWLTRHRSHPAGA